MIFIIAALITACANSPYADRLISQKPELKDADGPYKFERQTIRESELPDVDTKDSFIFLKADGTYQVSKVPYWGSSSDPDTTPVSATGKWAIDSVGTVINFWGHEKMYWGIVLKPIPRGFPDDIGFMGRAPSYQLLLNYDDRDLDEVMIFTKK
ncbi:hypothetical protein [Mucilaginibacter sp. PPCGB 2223]|uniref:hypothetical protein n=1 Tax=Mucilaginibacter sp. PPCGB 2223 TaxID=1886027 RepID=UPI001111FA9B|nr:hypothetical protein [Mucilaginibacter sp. PPCGB 2223]